MADFRVIETTIEAGLTAEFAALGLYYRILSSTGSVAIAVDSDDFQPLSVGIGVHEPKGFKHVRVKDTSGTSNTVMFAVSMGDITDTRFSLDGTNVVPVSLPGGAVSVSNAFFPDGLSEITRAGYGQIGASFFQTSGAIGIITVFLPATNINGVVLRTGSLNAYGSGFSALFSDIAAPVSIVDTSKRRILSVNSASSGEAVAVTSGALYIPPGLGLWFAGGGTNGGSATVTFDVL